MDVCISLGQKEQSSSQTFWLKRLELVFWEASLSLNCEVNPEHGTEPQAKEQDKQDQSSLNLKSVTTKRGNKLFEPTERVAQEEPVALMLIDAGGLSQVKTNSFERIFSWGVLWCQWCFVVSSLPIVPIRSFGNQDHGSSISRKGLRLDVERGSIESRIRVLPIMYCRIGWFDPCSSWKVRSWAPGVESPKVPKLIARVWES